MAYKRVSWPFGRHLQPKVNFTGDHLADLFVAHNRTSTELLADFERQAEQIDSDPHLTELGKQKARRELVTSFVGSDDMQRHKGSVEKGRARAKELLAELTAPAPPKDLSPFEQVSLANQNDRAIRRFEALQPADRRRALDRAIETREVSFLRPIHGEPGLLSAADAVRVQAVLLEQADPGKYRQLVELTGRPDPVNGTPDPTTSAVEVAGFAVDELLGHVHKWAGLDPASEAVRTRLEAAVKAKPDAPVALTNEEAHDPATYRIAKALAQQFSRPLQVIDDASGEIDASMDPAPASGDGGNNGAS